MANMFGTGMPQWMNQYAATSGNVPSAAVIEAMIQGALNSSADKRYQGGILQLQRDELERRKLADAQAREDRQKAIDNAKLMNYFQAGGGIVSGALGLLGKDRVDKGINWLLGGNKKTPDSVKISAADTNPNPENKPLDYRMTSGPLAGDTPVQKALPVGGSAVPQVWDPITNNYNNDNAYFGSISPGFRMDAFVPGDYTIKNTPAYSSSPVQRNTSESAGELPSYLMPRKDEYNFAGSNSYDPNVSWMNEPAFVNRPVTQDEADSWMNVIF